MSNGITGLRAYQQGGPILDKLRSLLEGIRGGVGDPGISGPTRREFLKRTGGIISLLNKLNVLDLFEDDEWKNVARDLLWKNKDVLESLNYSRPGLFPRDFMRRGFLTGPTSLARQGGYALVDVGFGPEFVSRTTGEVLPLWTKGGPSGTGFSDWLASADDALGHIPPLAPEMTAHGVTHPSMRAALLEEGAKMAPGEVIDPEILLERIGYGTEIGRARSNVEGLRMALEAVERGDEPYPSAFRSKEKHLAHYRAQQTKAKEELARLLRAKATSDEAVRRTTSGVGRGPSWGKGRFPGAFQSPVWYRGGWEFPARIAEEVAEEWRRYGGRRGIRSLILPAMGAGLGTMVTPGVGTAAGYGLGALFDVMTTPSSMDSSDLSEDLTEEEKLRLIKYYRDMNEKVRGIPGMDVPMDFFGDVTHGRSGVPEQTMSVGR